MQEIFRILIGAPVNPRQPAKVFDNRLSAGRTKNNFPLEIDVVFQICR